MGGASPEELSASCRVQPLGSSAAPHKGPFVSRGVRWREGLTSPRVKDPHPRRTGGVSSGESLGFDQTAVKGGE